MRIAYALCLLGCLLGLNKPASADLISRLGGVAVYDTDLDITWLADADMNGHMNWADALTWADGVTVAGFSDWRLPSTMEPDATCADHPARAGGFLCTGSEMGHLFYDELGGTAGSSILSSSDPDLALFSNLQSGRYWSGTPSAVYAPATHSWTFWFESGNQDQTNRSFRRFAFAVRDGDVDPIPEPSSLVLVGVSLAAALRTRRRTIRA